MIARVSHRIGLGLAALGLSGCMMVAPTPSGRVLRKGQRASTSSFAFANRVDRLRTVTTGAMQSDVSQDVEEKNPMTISWGMRHGLSDSGTEFGWQVEVAELGLDLRQALWRPVLEQDWATALQAEATGSPTSYSLSAALASTRDWGGQDVTVALRYGFASYKIFGAGTTQYSWSLTTFGTLSYPFVDVVLAFWPGPHPRGSGSVTLELLMRFPLQTQVLVDSSSYVRSSAPGAPVDTFVQSYGVPGPTLAATLRFGGRPRP